MRVGLAILVTVMWVMLLAIAAFLVLVVAPLESVADGMPRLAVSAIQAATAIAAVILFVFALSRLKRAYMNRKIPRV